MKKRLLITSIVMMLVVAVALSTATYAWFTSNATVTASSVTMTANTNNAQALGIGWDGGAAGTALTFTGALSVDPMIPLNLYTQAEANASVDDGITAATTSAIKFYSSTIKTVADHQVFNGAGQERSPFIFNDGATPTPVSAFYVKNMSTANDVANVQMQATITPGTSVYRPTVDTAIVEGKTYYTVDGETNYSAVAQNELAVANIGSYYEKFEATELVRVGVFQRDTAGSGAYKYINTISNTAGNKVCSGEITAGGNAETTGTGALTFEDTVDYINLGELSPLGQTDLVVIVWLDGYAFNDNYSTTTASVSLTFYATTANAAKVAA